MTSCTGFLSQWPRCLEHKLSLLARTLVSWVRITLKAWMSVCVYYVFLLFCIGSGLATDWSPVQRVLPIVCRIKKLKKRPRSSKKTRSIDGLVRIVLPLNFFSPSSVSIFRLPRVFYRCCSSHPPWVNRPNTSSSKTNVSIVLVLKFWLRWLRGIPFSGILKWTERYRIKENNVFQSKLWRFLLHNFLQISITSAAIGFYIFLSTLFSDTLNWYPFFGTRE
jgi:hypothetical protein